MRHALEPSGSAQVNARYNQDVVPGYLIRYYTSMVNFNDSVMNLHCVYNYPAVVLTLGRR